jgi:hypothetical protein
VEAADGGYVVHARDHRGRLRVRIVPDAQTVGVLIASWSADDRLDPEASPPGDRRPASPVDRAAPTAQRMLFSGLAGETYGGRGEIDVFGSRFPVGIVLAGQRHGTDTEFQLLAYVGATMVRQDWQLRVQLGAGIQQTRSRFVTSSLSEVMWGDQADRTLDAITELSLTASRHLVAGWGLTAGIVVTEPLSATEPDRIDSVTWDEKLHAGFYAPIPMALCGISHSL